jgi:hypothetical protein
MSDKDRQKKDGEREDKKNERMRESIDSRQQKNRGPRELAKHEAKMTDTIPKGEGRLRQR